jgi:hypothetical protein
VSRSYREPYTAIAGLPRSHDDKKKASRGVRYRQNTWLRGLKDYDLALVPHQHNVPSTIPTCGQETASSSSPSVTAASTAVAIWLGIAGLSSDGNR